jgi:hypothetical protein
MTKLFLLVFAVFLSVSFVFFFKDEWKNKNQSESDTIKKQIINIAETAYAEGQRDAIEGDVRIEIVSDSQVVFTKSPWDECNDEGNFKCDVSLFDTVETSKK